jgi:AraC family transcriptional regulator
MTVSCAAQYLPKSRRVETYDSHYRAVARVIDVMHADRTRTLSVNEMAKIAYMSHFHFIRVFEAVTGTSPWKFHWALKLHLAKGLLLSTKMPIIDISLEVGYNSHGTFTRRFTELVGLSPNRFRRIARSTDMQFFMQSLRQQQNIERTPTQIRGRVTPPPQFKGAMIVVCFPTALPQGRPLAYAWTDSDNRYSIEYPQTDSFYMQAFALPTDEGNLPWFMGESVLRSAEILHILDPHSSDIHDTAVSFSIRSQKPTDPPVLFSIGTLLQDENYCCLLDEPQGIHSVQPCVYSEGPTFCEQMA